MQKEGGGIQTHKESSPAEIRTVLMSKFQTNLDVLHPKIIEGRSKEGSPRQRPLITVVVSLREEDETLLASKMFSQALLNLRSQAGISRMDLDFVIVANNGGGKTEELGNKMVSKLANSLEVSFGKDNYHRINTAGPDQSNNPSIPWKAEIPLSAARSEGKDRCFFVV